MSEERGIEIASNIFRKAAQRKGREINSTYIQQENPNPNPGPRPNPRPRRRQNPTGNH